MAPGGTAWARWLPVAGKVGRRTAVQLVGLATWIPVAVWFNVHVAELTTVNGPSMAPLMNADGDATLRRDVVLNWKRAPQDGLRRGMVVTLMSPANPETVAVKRVVALEGDVVKTAPSYPVRRVTVPKNHVWVEGDGPQESSLDSRTYGPVSTRLLTGRVTHVVYPWKRMGRVKWWEHKRALAD